MWWSRLQLVEGIESEKVVKILGLVVQICGVLRLLQPLFTVCTEVLSKLLPQKKTKSILLPMKTHLTGNSKLRGVGYATADTVIDMLCKQPGGYMFWHSLPSRGAHSKKNTRKKLADTFLAQFFPDDFIKILIISSLTTEGKPIQPLYEWVVRNIYANNTQKLYKDWLEMKV